MNTSVYKRRNRKHAYSIKASLSLEEDAFCLLHCLSQGY